MMGIFIKTIPITWYRQNRDCEFAAIKGVNKHVSPAPRVDACQRSSKLSE